MGYDGLWLTRGWPRNEKESGNGERPEGIPAGTKCVVKAVPAGSSIYAAYLSQLFAELAKELESEG